MAGYNVVLGIARYCLDPSNVQRGMGGRHLLDSFDSFVAKQNLGEWRANLNLLGIFLNIPQEAISLQRKRVCATLLFATQEERKRSLVKRKGAGRKFGCWRRGDLTCKAAKPRSR